MKSRLVYIDQSGPMIRYGAGWLAIDDLNPETELRWRVPRWEAFRIALRLAWAALRGGDNAE